MSPSAVDGVLIVGGGYAGVHAARSVIRAGHRAYIVDPTGRHDLVTRLAAVAGGTAHVDDASIALSAFSDDVIVASMTAIDDGVVTLDDGRVLAADAVIVTAGSVPTTPPIPGIENAHPLRTAEDALSLRAQIDAADAIVIVGGGATGVQLAGAIGVRHPSKTVSLIDGEATLLATMEAATQRDAARILRDRKVRLCVGSDVDEIAESSVTVGGERIDGLVVWAAGFSPRAADFGLPVTESGRIEVDEDLRVRGWGSTFAAGDIAAQIDGSGDELPMSAQIAVQAGDIAGANAARLLDGEPLRVAHLAHRGWVLDLSGCRGLAEIGPVTLTGPFLDLVPPVLHWGIDVKHLIDTRGLAGLDARPH